MSFRTNTIQRSIFNCYGHEIHLCARAIDLSDTRVDPGCFLAFTFFKSLYIYNTTTNVLSHCIHVPPPPPLPHA